MASLVPALVAGSLVAGAAFPSSLFNGLEARLAANHDATDVASADPLTQELEAPYRRLALALQSAGIAPVTNTSSCRTKDVVGFHTYRSGRIELCTDKIRLITQGSGGYRTLLQATLAHEAAHVAQFCRADRTGGPPTVGIAAARLYALPPELRQDLSRALGIGTYNLPRSLAWRQEAEAFYLEDKPEQVAVMLARYC